MNKDNLLQKIVKLLHSIETWVLVGLLSLMIVISILQFVLNIFKHPVNWFGPLLRYTVLWTGMLAAGVATQEHKHIKIDVIGRFAKGRLRNLVLFQTNLLTAVVCGLLTVLSAMYIINIEFLSTAQPPFLNIPSWVLLLILPIGFFIITARFMARAVQKIINIIKNVDDSDEAEDYSLETIESEKDTVEQSK